MAVDLFIKIGDIKGESTDAGHANEIEVATWSWGMTQTGSTHSGTGAGTGKVAVNDLTFSKYVDIASPALLQACCAGTHYATGLLTARKAGASPLDYWKITLYDIIVSGVKHGGTGADDRQTEEISLNFGQFEVTYTSQTKTGGAGPSIPMGWNIPGNTSKINK
jgi:type VI secretion system secreted protein Hcp